MKIKRLTYGVTLLEMLISMAILGVILTLVANYLTSGLRVTAVVANQAQLQEELRTAGGLIADEVQRAIYVFPPCGEYGTRKTALGVYETLTPTIDNGCDAVNTAEGDDPNRVRVSFSMFSLAQSGTTLYNSGGGTNKYIWQVGAPLSTAPSTNLLKGIQSSPFLAMIVAPRDSKMQCRISSTEVQHAGCYQFVAYYPVLRKYLTREYTPGSNEPNKVNVKDEGGSDVTNPDGSAIPVEQLDPNADNGNQWVLMEYRRSLDTNIASTGSAIGTSNDKATMPRTDLIGPGGASVTLEVPRINWGSVGCGLSSTAAPNQYSLTCPTSGSGTTFVQYKNPNPDANPENQLSPNSIPALRRGTQDVNAIMSFRRRIIATHDWIETNWSPGSGKILVDNIRPDTGFQVEFPNNSIDERGVTEVRLKLQMEIKRGLNSSVQVPGSPLEFFSTPRNISPL
jgi:prepilin-type N-terminal cleavage/methylation domain-containing protein